MAATLSDSGKGLYSQSPYPNRDQELAGITSGMKQLAMEHQPLLIVSSSLSRNVEHRHGRTPFLTDLRESGMIGENSDNLTFSGERPPEAGFFESVTRITGEYGFTLNRRKTRIQKSTSRQTVTGIVANQKPNVDREYKRKLRAQLHTLDMLGPYMATCKNFRLKEAPAHLVSQYLLTLEGKKKFVEMVGKYS